MRRNDIPGLKRLPKPNGFSTWYWAASQITRRADGFEPKTARLWHGQGVPTEEELEAIRRRSVQLSIDLEEWCLANRPDAHRRGLPRSKRGSIYFVRAGERVKIGFSQDHERRLSQLQTFFPEQLEVLLVMPGSITIERSLHRRFQDYLIAREWFLYAQPIVEFVARERAVQSAVARNKGGPSEPDSFQNRQDVRIGA